MAATKPPVSQRRMQPTSFALEGRPMSSESLGTIRRKFLTAPVPEPPPDDDQDEFHRPPKVPFLSYSFQQLLSLNNSDYFCLTLFMFT